MLGVAVVVGARAATRFLRLRLMRGALGALGALRGRRLALHMRTGEERGGGGGCGTGTLHRVEELLLQRQQRLLRVRRSFVAQAHRGCAPATYPINYLGCNTDVLVRSSWRKHARSGGREELVGSLR